MERHGQQFPLDQADAERAMDVLRALADPTRLQLVLLLKEGERSVGELVDILSLPQSSVSRHLAYLRRTKLVRTRRSGATVFYSLGNAHIGHIVLESLSFSEHERLALPDHKGVRTNLVPPHRASGARR